MWLHALTPPASRWRSANIRSVSARTKLSTLTAVLIRSPPVDEPKSIVVSGAGWHDTYFRWDISTPQRVVSRLEQLPGQGSLSQPGKKLYEERDRFGKWQHLLGPENVLLSYTVHTPKHGIIRRLEVQAHLGESGENDPCAPSVFDQRWEKLQLLMATASARQRARAPSG